MSRAAGLALAGRPPGTTSTPRERAVLTADQQAADAQLRAAIEAVVKAFDLAPDHELITDYVVSGVAVSMADEREGETKMFCTMTGGSLPHYKVLGLLRQAQIFYEHDL